MPERVATPRRRRRRAWIAALALVAIAVALVAAVALLGGGEKRARPRAAAAEPPYARPLLFAPQSVWNARLPASARLDPGSARSMSAFAAEIARERQRGIGPWIQTTESSVALYVAGPDQRRVPVKLDETAPWAASLRAALAAGVPIPAGARPARGDDAHMTVYQPSSDTLWEMWRTRREADGWHARWGGAMHHVSTGPGYFTASAWPGAQYTWGATATSLPVIGGTVLIRELRRGRIDHALALDVPDARSGIWAWPAQRTDGSGGPSTLPEGARLRLDPKLDVDSLNLPPVTAMLARAAQRYGIVIRDVTHNATAFYMEDPASTGTDPYGGPHGLFGGQTPAQLLARFPWNRLELLKMSLCTHAICRKGDAP